MTDPTPLLIEILHQQTAAFDARLDTLQHSVDGINTRLDAQNGRLRKAENAITRLKTIGAGGVALTSIALGAVLRHLFGL